MKPIYPVILKVSPHAKTLHGKERVKLLSKLARKALAQSAQKGGLVLGELKKNRKGAPLPFNGIYWSLTHKATYVGGVAADKPIGIDIEEIRPMAKSVLRRIATPAEERLFGGDPLIRFFRYWTSKEAVLKGTGRGMAGLSGCRIVDVTGPDRLLIHCEGQEWPVEHLYFDGHIASVVKQDFEVEWILLEQVIYQSFLS